MFHNIHISGICQRVWIEASLKVRQRARKGNADRPSCGLSPRSGLHLGDEMTVGDHLGQLGSGWVQPRGYVNRCAKMDRRSPPLRCSPVLCPPVLPISGTIPTTQRVVRRPFIFLLGAMPLVASTQLEAAQTAVSTATPFQLPYPPRHRRRQHPNRLVLALTCIARLAEPTVASAKAG